MDEIVLEDSKSGMLVSNLGRIFGPSGVELKCQHTKNGYCYVTSYKDGKRKNYYVHRLVAESFIPNPMQLKEVNHIDENKDNNVVWNLEFCTSAYNLTYNGGRDRRLKRFIDNGHGKQITLTNGAVIKTFETYAEAARYIGSDKSNVATLLANKRLKSVNGWHLIGVNPPPKIDPVSITLTNGIETVEFHSHYAAAKYIGIHKSHLLMLLSGKERSARGWHLPGVVPGIVQPPKSFTITNGIETKSFSSIHEASRITGCPRPSLSKLVRGIFKQANGWKLVK